MKMRIFNTNMDGVIILLYNLNNARTMCAAWIIDILKMHKEHRWDHTIVWIIRKMINKWRDIK